MGVKFYFYFLFLFILFSDVTAIASTTPPTTRPPSTIITSTTVQSTVQPTLSPSTLSPSTSQPTNNLPTQIPSSVIPSTVLPTISCAYQVDNCQNCPQNPIIVDLNVFKVECTKITGKWYWIFTNKTSDTFVSDSTITFNSSITYIIGNFTQTDKSNLVFIADSSNSSSLVVSGCVDLKGKITLEFTIEPTSNTTYTIITYNCSQIASLEDSQVDVVSTFKQDKCLKHKVLNQQSTISVSLSTSGCSKSIPKGVIAAIVIVCFCVVAFGIIFGIIFYKKRRNISERKMSQVENQMKNI